MTACNDVKEDTSQSLEPVTSEVAGNEGEANVEEQLEDWEMLGPAEQFLYFKDQMESWSSYELNATSEHIYADDEMVDSIIDQQIRLVVEPDPQVYQYYYSSGFRLDLAETYGNDSFGISNTNMNSWMKIESPQHLLKNRIPAIAELLNVLIVSGEEFVTTEDFDAPKVGHLFVTPENYPVIYEKLQLALHYNLTDEEVPTSDYDLRLEDADYVEEIYAEMYLQHKQITGFTVSVTTRSRIEGEFDIWKVDHKFTDVNAFNTIEFPEEALAEVGL